MGATAPLIAVFTDFGVAGPYTGQVLAVLSRDAPTVPAIPLMSDAPAHAVRASAHLLAALATRMAAGTVFLAVVDPGVGTRSREPIALRADAHWFVGPGNGLLDVVAGRAASVRGWRIEWPDAGVAPTFHGRDLFAPVAALVARGEPVPGVELPATAIAAMRRPADLAEIVYVDGFGNAMTGVRAATLSRSAVVTAGGSALRFAPTFGAVPVGAPFWYENSIGLVELAVNQGRASEVLALRLGDAVDVTDPASDAASR